METHPAGPSSILHWKSDGVIAPSEHAAGAYSFWTSQEALVEKNLLAIAGDVRDAGSIPGSSRFLWRRKWQPTPVFLPGESQEQRSLEGYSSWGCKELNTTKVT